MKKDDASAVRFELVQFSLVYTTINSVSVTSIQIQDRQIAVPDSLKEITLAISTNKEGGSRLCNISKNIWQLLKIYLNSYGVINYACEGPISTDTLINDITSSLKGFVRGLILYCDVFQQAHRSLSLSQETFLAPFEISFSEGISLAIKFKDGEIPSSVTSQDGPFIIEQFDICKPDKSKITLDKFGDTSPVMQHVFDYLLSNKILGSIITHELSTRVSSGKISKDANNSVKRYRFYLTGSFTFGVTPPRKKSGSSKDQVVSLV